MRKWFTIFVSLLCLLAFSGPVAAGGGGEEFPPEIDLPDGFFGEGIAIGRGTSFYVGSLADGSIYKGDLRTGDGAVLTAPTGALPFTTVGLDVDRYERVWAAGAAAGTGRVYDGFTGALLATYQFAPPLDSFINDVIVTSEAAWFTDSGTRNCNPAIPELCFAGEPRLFKVTLNGGQLPDPQAPGAVEEISVDVPDVYFSNLNGIVTWPGETELILVHNELGRLYRFNPVNGDVSVLYGPPDDPALMGADGMVRDGRILYVVENAAGQVSVLRLHRSTETASLRSVLPVPGAQTPSTAALYQSTLYVVDPRLATPFVGPYFVFRVDR